ncbi:MAG: hypothetical protein ACOY82_08905 [Pseudomonadota bacterium]
MPEQRPLKYALGQHTPFAPGDTLPPDVIPPESFARVFKTCAGADHAPGNAIPTCAELAEAIELAQQIFLNRIVAGTGIAITVGPGGTRIITNTCCDSQHTLVGIVPLATPIVEGQAACWRIEVTPAVAGRDLPLTLSLFGSEQVLRGYPAPVGVVIPVGQTAVEVCVATLDDSAVLGARELCLQVASPRLSPVGSACIAILDNDEAPPSTHTITAVNVSPGYTVPEGTHVCWEIVLDAPVTGAAVTIPVSLSGDEQAIHGYAIASPLTIPVGQSRASVCVQTTDDAIDEPDRELGLDIGTTPRIPTFPGGRVPVTITDNDVTLALIDITSDHPGAVSPGETVCWTVYLNGPAPVGGFPFVVTVSGSVVDGGQVCASYDSTASGPVLTTLSGQIVAGATTATVCTLLPSTPGLPAGALARDAGQCFALDCTPPNANVYTADLTIAPNGAIGGAAAGDGGNWIGSSGVNPADYEARVSGGLSDGPDGLEVWVSLGAARAWTRTLGCGTSATIGGRVQIRRISDQQLVVDEPYGGYQVYTGVNAVCP